MQLILAQVEGIWIFLGVLILIPLAIVFYSIAIYNGLVALRNGYENAFSQIDVQLTRRYDLIQNLVETAKGYMKHERETLEAVIEARNQAVTAGQNAAAAPGDPKAMQGLMGAEAVLTGTMGKLFALAENYPDLKANENMLSLQDELTSTEDKVSYSREGFNNAVTRFNIKRESLVDFQKGVFTDERDSITLVFHVVQIFSYDIPFNI